jgi:hypothetical protein
MTFDSQWSSLEAKASGVGEVRRRIFPDSVADLWLVVHGPKNSRALRVEVGADALDIEDPPRGGGIELGVTADPIGGTTLQISLTNPGYADLFDALVADVAGAASEAETEKEVSVLVTTRVRRWQAFLREHSEGLGAEAQRGLFGELHALRTVLGAVGDTAAIEGWVGPGGAPQDFNFGEVAIEVKTSAGKNPQTLRISSERQLDDSPLRALYLWHLSVDERIGAGQTLPELVSEVRGLVEGTAAIGLEDTLLTAGYHDGHARRYRTGYTPRSSGVYRVGEGFPRLTERDCPVGLGDVRYSIELGAIEAFRFERRDLLQRLAEGLSDD